MSPTDPEPTFQNADPAVARGFRVPDVSVEGPAGQSPFRFSGSGTLTVTHPPPRTREVRLERRLNATCAAAEGLTDRGNLLDEDDQYIILRRQAVELAQGVAKRNKRDLESGEI